MRIRMIVLTTGLLAFTAAPRSTWDQTDLRSVHFRTSDGVEIHYLEAGTGATLVFVPGWTMPAEIWEPQLRHFAATYRVIALDPRGQGRSERPAYGYYPSRRALDISELLQHLGDAPAVVVAWSLAVQEVLVLTDEFGTEDVRALVLVDYPINIDGDVFRSRFISLQVEREEWTRRFIRGMFRSFQTNEYLEVMTEAALSTPTNATTIMIANLILMGPTDLRPLLDSLNRPSLFVASSQDGSVAAADEVSRGWPSVRVEVIDGTSHAVFVDRPEEFNRVLEEFLASLAG
jgi:non-heme chloroperoxidase